MMMIKIEITHSISRINLITVSECLSDYVILGQTYFRNIAAMVNSAIVVIYLNLGATGSTICNYYLHT